MTTHHYRGWVIYFDPPPIPIRTLDWTYSHDSFDGAPDANDNRYGYAPSLEQAKRDIDEIEEDREPSFEEIEAELAATRPARNPPSVLGSRQ